MPLMMPTLIVLFGDRACEQEERLTFSLREHLTPAELRALHFWRVGVAEPDTATQALPGREFTLENLREPNYIETAFAYDYEEITGRLTGLHTGSGQLHYWYLCTLAWGGDTPAALIGNVRRRIQYLLDQKNMGVRAHLLWLIEDEMGRTAENYSMLAEDIERKNVNLSDFHRITVLSGVQNNSVNTFATRQERLDALVPCMLETANAPQLTGLKVQTVAYRKLNCTAHELRQLLAHRVQEQLVHWQSNADGFIPLWELFSDGTLPLAAGVQQSVEDTARILLQATQADLPQREDYLLMLAPNRWKEAAVNAENLSVHSRDAILESLAGKAWLAGWQHTVEKHLRGYFPLRTALEFIQPQGVLLDRLTVLQEWLDVERKAQQYANTYPANASGLFGRKKTEIDAFLQAVDHSRRSLACEVLLKRVHLLCETLPQLCAFIEGLLAASARSLKGYRLSEETAELYSAFAPQFDSLAQSTVREIAPLHRDVLGESGLYYPAEEAELNRVWKGYQQRLLAATRNKKDSLQNSFVSTFVQERTGAQLERELSQMLDAHAWQMAGASVQDTDETVYFANAVLNGKLPSGTLQQYPIRTIPGDLVECIRFGNVTDTLRDLSTSPSFAKKAPFDIHPSVQRSGGGNRQIDPPQAVREAEPIILSGKEAAVPKPEEQNPWNVRLEKREQDFMLKWAWPDFARGIAIIQFRHADGRSTTVSCSHELYAQEMGRPIGVDKLGIGWNHVSIRYDNCNTEADIIGCRTLVRYAVQQKGRPQTVALDGNPVPLMRYELQIRQESNPQLDQLLVKLYTPGNIPMLCTLPADASASDPNLYTCTLYTPATRVELACTSAYEPQVQMMPTDILS